jgi:endonuclease YncB( thermonuclease family)
VLIVATAAVLLAAAGWLKWWSPLAELPAAAFPFVAVGTAEAVDDGDTFVFAADELPADVPGRFKVRLHGVDAPELAQFHGWAARSALKRLTGGESLRLDCYKRDAGGRAVCRVRALGATGDTDVELALLTEGHAWHFRGFAGEQTPAERSNYAAAEARARAAQRGLWKQGTPMPPWICREQLRAASNCD